MSRVGALLATIVPSVIAGGLLLGSASGHAESGRDDARGYWPVGSDPMTGVQVAQLDPWSHPRPRVPPPPPVPPAPPVPGAIPAPPVPPVPAPPPRVRGRHHGHGVSVSIHDGKIELDGIEELVADQLERVDDVLDNMQDVPPEVRERVKNRVRAVREKLRVRLGKLRSLDLDKIGPEMERLGDEIEREMEGLDKDLAQFGERFGKQFAHKFGRDFAKGVGPARVSGSRDHDHSDDGDDDGDDDDHDAVSADDDVMDPSDMRSAVAELRNLALDQTQKARLAQVRAESERKITDAKRELEAMQSRLHDTLGDLGASEADIAKQIDMISATEATIRKARILAWVRVRNLLDDEQRKKVEAAARHH
ncbi:MAG TPA: hypothetical protein VFK02_34895 [Kofleriaceae bacterium]|nr:hypothetical protein [Kofleriaceae bacterium]